ncbi:MAG: YjbQ family protein [Bacteroidetes bacterium]|nr:MAG: YjbQ family protein [Bacteroidota bacterium]
MIIQKEIILPVFKRGYHLITDLILSEIPKMKGNGILNIFIKHTSAGLTINENADYTVREDFETVFNHLIPENQTYYKHTFEGVDDLPAHIKTSIIGNSVNIPVTDSHLNLGTWQGIYLCEFRNRGGRRKLVLTFYS